MCIWEKKETAVPKPPQQNWPGVEMDGLQKRMHSSPPSSLSNSKGSPLAPHPWAGHMSPSSVTW